MNELELLINDYKSSQIPQWYDPKSLDALRRIVNSILKGDYNLQNFEDFAYRNFGEGNYQKGCCDFVRCVLMYFNK